MPVTVQRGGGATNLDEDFREKTTSKRKGRSQKGEHVGCGEGGRGALVYVFGAHYGKRAHCGNCRKFSVTGGAAREDGHEEGVVSVSRRKLRG